MQIPTDKTSYRLEQQICSALKVEYLGSGRQILRDERRFKIDEFRVECAWQVTIRPSFDPIAHLAVLYQQERRRAAFAIDQDENASADGGQVCIAEFAADWQDPVLQALRGTEFLEIDDMRSLDGIGYDLAVDTSALNATIHFSNPHLKSLIELEQAFLKVAGEIVAGAASKEIEAYFHVWQRYCTSHKKRL